jgi:membrane protease YdiL (CAAX protease family)
MEPNKISLNTLLLSVAAIVLVETAARAAILKGIFIPMIGTGLARCCQIILLILITLRQGKKLIPIGLAPATVSQGFKKGLLWSAGCGAVAGLSLVILILSGIDVLAFFRMRPAGSPKDILLLFGVGAIIGPLFEEIFFRGILYGFLRRWGFFVALSISTVLFVLPHASAYSAPVTQAAGGLLFAVAYELEKNLIVPITIHVLGNLTIFFLGLIA